MATSAATTASLRHRNGAKGHHPGLPHAFLNAILYLDYHRTGFDYPVIPFPINCYGRRVISYQGFASRVDDIRELDPPSPHPARMVTVGAAVGQIMAESPWRVALVASSSWSHAFLCDKTWRLRPDTATDRYLYDRLLAGDVDAWRAVSLTDLEDSGQQELLNWFPLLGAMEALGTPRPSWTEFIETDVLWQAAFAITATCYFFVDVRTSRPTIYIPFIVSS